MMDSVLSLQLPATRLMYKSGRWGGGEHWEVGRWGTLGGGEVETFTPIQH